MPVVIERNVLEEIGKIFDKAEDFEKESNQRIEIIERKLIENHDLNVANSLRMEAVEYSVRSDRLIAKIHEILSLAHTVNADYKVLSEDTNSWEKRYQILSEKEIV